MSTEKTLYTQNKTVYKITAMCENVARRNWEKGTVAGIYRNCFNILTEDGYMLTIFKKVVCYSTRAMITDIKEDMSKLPIRNGDKVYRVGDLIQIGDVAFRTDKADMINVKREPEPATDICDGHIEYFREVLHINSVGRPVIYDKYLEQKAKAGFEILKTDPLKSFDMLIGLGIGLTPSCDDIIGGISAYLYLRGAGQRFNTELKKFLEQKGDRVTSYVSKNLLEDVAYGYINPTLYNLINAIMHDKENIEKYTLELMNYGSTSGTETCMGILFAQELMADKEDIKWL